MSKPRIIPAGYHVTDDGAAAFQPADSYAPPHRITAPGASPQRRAAAIEQHAERVRTGTTWARDWPAFLVQYDGSRRPTPWRRLPLGPRGRRMPGGATWHATLVQALFS